MTLRPKRPSCSPCLSTSGRTSPSGPKPMPPCTIQRRSQSSSSTGSNILRTTSPKIWRLENPKKLPVPEQTLVYDPKTKGVRLQLWSDYERENKRTWKQDYAAIYDGETKSVKLVYWIDYVENYLPFDIKARETMQKKQNQKVS